MGIGCLICDDLIESGAPEDSVNTNNDNTKPKTTASNSKKRTLPPATVNDSIVTPCGHIFHELCLEQWFKNKKTGTCPVCRKTCTKAKLIRIFPSLVEDDKVELGPSTSNALAKKENSKEAPETKPIVPPKPQISQASPVSFANTFRLREIPAAPWNSLTVQGNPPTTTNMDGTALDRNKRLLTYLNALDLRTNTVGDQINDNNAVSSVAAAYYDGIRRRLAIMNSQKALGIPNSRASFTSAAAESLNLVNDNSRTNCPSTSSAASAQDESINTLETFRKKLNALSNGFKVPEKTNAASTSAGGQSTSQAIAGTSQSGNNQAMQNPPVPNVKTEAPAVIHIQDRVPEEPAHAHKCQRYEELKVIHNTLMTDYSELQLKCNDLEDENQLLKVQLESCEDEMKKLRRGTSGSCGSPEVFEFGSMLSPPRPRTAIVTNGFIEIGSPFSSPNTATAAVPKQAQKRPIHLFPSVTLPTRLNSGPGTSTSTSTGEPMAKRSPPKNINHNRTTTTSNSTSNFDYLTDFFNNIIIPPRSMSMSSSASNAKKGSSTDDLSAKSQSVTKPETKEP